MVTDEEKEFARGRVCSCFDRPETETMILVSSERESSPSNLAKFFRVFAPLFFAQFPSSKATPAEVAGLVAAGAWGPEKTLVPERTLGRLVAGMAFSTSGLETSFERGLCWSLTGMPTPYRSWDQRWIGSFFALRNVLSRLICPSVIWLRDHLEDHPDEIFPGNDPWPESFRNAGIIAAILLSDVGCRCAEHLERMGRMTEGTAAQSCNRYHHLRNWDRRTPLNDLLRIAARGRYELPAIREFAKGLLPKTYAYGMLFIGRAMRCREADCGSEVNREDKGAQGHCPCKVSEPNFYGAWYLDQRQIVPVKRCKTCDYVYFNFRGLCPLGHDNWGEESNAWVRRRELVFDEFDPPDTRDRPDAGDRMR
jgi:hypothetical protein